MVNHCRVVGCTNRSGREKHLEFYRLPKVIRNQGEACQALSEERRRLWLEKLNQDFKGKNLDNIRVCSAHFLSGKRAGLEYKDDPDWVPSVGMSLTRQQHGSIQPTKETATSSRYQHCVNIKPRSLQNWGQERNQYCAEAATAERELRKIAPKLRHLQIHNHLTQMKIKVASLKELGVESCFMAFDNQNLEAHAYGSDAAMAFLVSSHTTNSFASHFQEQCMESRLQLKMCYPDSASDISIKEEPEGVSVKLEPDDPQLNILHMIVGEDVSPEQERSPSLLQEEPEPPYIKEEQEELKEEPEPPYDISSHCTEVEVEIESDCEVTEDGNDLEESIEDDDDQQGDKSFTDSSSRKKPQRVNTGGRPFHCKRCDKSFRYASDIKRHQYFHTGEKPFQCKVCDKTFWAALHLKAHFRVHTGKKTFQCKHCDRRFSDSSNLRRHRYVHK